jgi:hypothetical protein
VKIDEPKECKKMARMALRIISTSGLVLLFVLLVTPSAVAETSDTYRIPEAGALKKLAYANGTTNPITPEDVLWAARMIHGETGGRPTDEDAAAMLWAIAQRSYWSTTWNRHTLSELVQAYSQPINPKWSREGSACREYNGKTQELPQSHACAEHRLKLREKYRRLEWNELSEVARRATIAFAEGKVTNPIPGGIGWFAKGEWARSESTGYNRQEHREGRWEIRRNVFFCSNQNDRDVRRNVSFNSCNWSGKEVSVR